MQGTLHQPEVFLRDRSPNRAAIYTQFRYYGISRNDFCFRGFPVAVLTPQFFTITRIQNLFLFQKQDVLHPARQRIDYPNTKSPETVALHYPELEAQLPPPRKIWMSEDERMAIFEAVAFALTFIHGPSGGPDAHID